MKFASICSEWSSSVYCDYFSCNIKDEPGPTTNLELILPIHCCALTLFPEEVPHVFGSNLKRAPTGVETADI
jgi:hypothetical protein